MGLFWITHFHTKFKIERNNQKQNYFYHKPTMAKQKPTIRRQQLIISTNMPTLNKKKLLFLNGRNEKSLLTDTSPPLLGHSKLINSSLEGTHREWLNPCGLKNCTIVINPTIDKTTQPRRNAGIRVTPSWSLSPKNKNKHFRHFLKRVCVQNFRLPSFFVYTDIYRSQYKSFTRARVHGFDT